MNVEERLAIEQQLIRHLVCTMDQHGWAVKCVDDGEERVPCANEQEIVDAVFSVDESHIVFQRDGVCHTVFVVLGNDGWDAICDYSYSDSDNFGEIMETEIEPFASTLHP